MTEECYKILPLNKIEERLSSDSLKMSDFDTCLLNSGALVFFLRNGETVLVSGEHSDNSNGIIFDSKECYLHYLENDKFPIQNDKLTIEELFQSDILCIDQKINDFIKYFSNLKKRPINGDDDGVIVELLQSLKQKNKNKKLSKQEFFYSSAILGEYVRRKNNGKWILLKKYGSYNPYYTIGIIYPDSSIFYLRNYSDSYFKNSTITPENFVNLPYVKKPGLLLGTPFFKNNFWGYIIR